MNTEDIYSVSQAQLQMMMKMLTNGKQIDFFRDVFVATNLPRIEFLRQKGSLAMESLTENIIFTTLQFQQRYLSRHIEYCFEIGRVSNELRDGFSDEERKFCLYRNDKLYRPIHELRKHEKEEVKQREKDAIRFKTAPSPVDSLDDIKYLLPDRRLWNIYHFHSNIFLYSQHSINAAIDFQADRDVESNDRWNFK